MFENGKLNGQAQLKYSNGDYLEGFLLDGKIHGFS